MASTFTCPKGHTSADNDFCSECGAKIQNASPAAAIVSDTGNSRRCPDCGAPVPAPGINFCEICGYNFVTQTSGQFLQQVAQTPPAPVNTAPLRGFTLLVAVDATLRDATSPEAPPSAEPFMYTIDKPANLIGRKSEARAIFPDISLDSDTAVSHRHGIISPTPDGLVYRDLGSSNGTRLNGTEVTPLADIPLQAGDRLTLGHWTRITVQTN
jgi:hypothetical protein